MTGDIRRAQREGRSEAGAGQEYLYIAERSATARERRIESKSSVDLDAKREILRGRGAEKMQRCDATNMARCPAPNPNHHMIMSRPRAVRSAVRCGPIRVVGADTCGADGGHLRSHEERSFDRMQSYKKKGVRARL